MRDTPTEGHPLDQHEERTLQMIEQQVRRCDPDFPQRVGSRPGCWHPPIRQIGTALRGRVVAAVLLAALLYAGLLTLLPGPLMLVAVAVVQLVVIPVGCLIWAARNGEL